MKHASSRLPALMAFLVLAACSKEPGPASEVEAQGAGEPQAQAAEATPESPEVALSVWTAVENALRLAEEEAPEGLTVKALAVGLGAAGTPGADALVRLHPATEDGADAAPATAVADWLEALVARPEVVGGWAFATLTRTEVEAGLRPPVLVLDLDLAGTFRGFAGEFAERSSLEIRIRELAASDELRLGAVDVAKKPHRYEVR